ncbi:Endogenous retrovirus group 3 member 1 Env polyprotein [Plecturocebus cupreus]
MQERMPISLTERAHSFKPGDSVWVKKWNPTSLGPIWNGPHTVILFTPTAIKVANIVPWIHHSRLKPAAQDEWTSQQVPVSVQEEGQLIEGCPHCMHTTWIRNTVVKTLLYQKYYECTGTHLRTCTYNQATYSVCDPGNGQSYACYELKYSAGSWFEVRIKEEDRWNLLNQTKAPPSQKEAIDLYFNFCQVKFTSIAPSAITNSTGFTTACHRTRCLSPACWGTISWNCLTWFSNQQQPKQVMVMKTASFFLLKPDCKVSSCHPVTLSILKPDLSIWIYG